MNFTKLFYASIALIFLSALNAQPTQNLEAPRSINIDAKKNTVSTIKATNPKLERLIKAALAGNLEAQYELGDYYANPDEKSWKPNISEAVRWWTMASEKGHAKSLTSLGFLHFNGEFFPRNIHKASEFWMEAAKLGDPEAQYFIGICYANGLGLIKNKYNAFQWWAKAVEGGDEKAMVNLGLCYARGEGVKKNSSKAIEIWTKAAEAGNPVAQAKLASCYFTGDGVEANTKKAVAIWTASAEAGNIESMRNLALCYKEGAGGLPPDFEKFKQWIQLAAKGGDKEAIQTIKTHPALR